MINTGSYSAGVFGSPFRSICLSVSCLIHDDQGNNVMHEYSPDSCCCNAIMLLVIVCRGGCEEVVYRHMLEKHVLPVFRSLLLGFFCNVVGKEKASHYSPMTFSIPA